MPTKLSDDDAKLLEEPNHGHFATLMPDGSPQVTPGWVDTRDAQIWVNTAEGRVKTRNVRRDPFLARKYLGVDGYPNRVPGERRVIVKIQPEHVARMR